MAKKKKSTTVQAGLNQKSEQAELSQNCTCPECHREIQSAPEDWIGSFKFELSKSIFMLFTRIELCINFFETVESGTADEPCELITELTDCVDEMFYVMGDTFDGEKLDASETDTEMYDRIIKGYYEMEHVDNLPRIQFSQTDTLLLWCLLEDHYCVLTCIQFLMMPVELYTRFNMLHSKKNLDNLLRDYMEYMKFLLNILYKYRTPVSDPSLKQVINLLLSKIKRVQGVVGM